MGGEDALDLAQLHSIAADLDLLIRAPRELDVAVRQYAAQVTGAVEPCPRRPERVRHELLSGLRGAPEITARYAAPADTDLARHADGHGPRRLVQDVHGSVRDRPADRHHLTTRRAVDRIGRVADGDLGRAVLVDQPPLAQPVVPLPRHMVEQHIAPGHHGAGQTVDPGRVQLVREHLQMSRGELDEGVRLAGHEPLAEFGHVQPLREHVHGPTDEQGREPHCLSATLFVARGSWVQVRASASRPMSAAVARMVSRSRQCAQNAPVWPSPTRLVRNGLSA